MNITALCCSSWGPRAYRVEMPLAGLRRRGHNTRIIEVKDGMAWSPAWFDGWDIVIIQRQHDVRFFEMMACLHPERRPAVIYETDDLLWALPEDSKDYDGLQRSGAAQGMKRMMVLADAVTVSTLELAKQASKFNDRVFTVGNGIDFDGRDWSPGSGDRPSRHDTVIGWAGSIRSARDMTVMGDALRDVMLAHPQACFAIGGDEEQSAAFCHALRLPEGQVYILPPATFESYPRLISRFDVGIAPLAIHTANACKSELKLMEYGALGIPYVATDIEPYQRFQQCTGGDWGFLARTEHSWRTYLEWMVTHPVERKAMGACLRDEVMSAYRLEDTIGVWEAVFSQVAPKRVLDGSLGEVCPSPEEEIERRYRETTKGGFRWN